jgi:hypothetical protein
MVATINVRSDDFKLTTSLLAAALYQGIHDRNHKVWDIGSFAGAAGMLLHINGKFTVGKLKSSLLP